MVAANKGHEDCVRRLIEIGAAINVANKVCYVIYTHLTGNVTMHRITHVHDDVCSEIRIIFRWGHASLAAQIATKIV